MNETYAEYLIKRKTPAYAWIIIGLLGLITAFFIFMALTGGIISMILMFVSGFLTYMAYRNFHVEFEYLYVDRQLNVDRILGKAKRKKAYECTMDEIQLIAPSGAHVLDDYRGGKVLNCASREPGAKTYTAVVQKSGETVKLIFEPNDKMLQCFRQTAPRKVMQ
ncbi:MAG: DUF6106 family protein [Eubacteriales bacterium]|nr:DUF6106 family protein [Eubacteriales bacterium]